MRLFTNRDRRGAAAVGYHDSIFMPLMALFLLLLLAFGIAAANQPMMTKAIATAVTTAPTLQVALGDPHGIRSVAVDCATGKELAPVLGIKRLLAYGSDNGIGSCSHWIKRRDLPAARQSCPGCHGHVGNGITKEIAPAATARLTDEEGRWNDNIQLASTQPVESWKFKAPDVCLAMVTESGLTRTRLVEQLAFKYGTARHKRGLAVNDRRLWIARQFGIQLACVRLGAEQNTVKAIDEPAAPSRALPTILGLTV